MLYVKTKLKESKIQGIGLFADQFIKKGTIVWKFTKGFDLKFTKAELERLPIPAQKYLGIYLWRSKEKGKWCLSSDNGKYFNHSENPNVLSAFYDDEEEVVTKAIKDIKKGEEITDNYSSFEKGFKTPRGWKSNKN